MYRGALSDFLRAVVLSAIPAAAGCCSDSTDVRDVSVDAFYDQVGDGGELPDASCARICASVSVPRSTLKAVRSCRAVLKDVDGGIVEVECVDDFQHCASFLPGGRPPPGLRPRGPAAATNELGAFFAAMAHVEGAAVAGFRHLAGELERHGAPSVLVDAALRAAKDEHRHACAAATLAQRFSARPPAIVVDPVAPRELEALACDNAAEGCVVETFGAAVTLHQAERARDPVIRRVFARISVEELRHAELAAQVARWAAARLDGSARRRVRQAQARAVRRVAEAIEHEPPSPLVEAAGLPPAATARRLFAALHERLWS